MPSSASHMTKKRRKCPSPRFFRAAETRSLFIAEADRCSQFTRRIFSSISHAGYSWLDLVESIDKSLRHGLPSRPIEASDGRVKNFAFGASIVLFVPAIRSVLHRVPQEKVGRVRKTTISDVASRLSSLERSITAATTGGAVQAEKTPSSGLVGSSPQAKGRVSPTILLHSQNSSQYFDELLTTRVIEEDRDKPSLLRRSAGENQVEARDTLSSLMGTSLKTIAADGTDKNWQPRTRGALELWRVFTQNVDPSMKILHIPTAEVLFFEAIREPEAVSKDASVTLCAVYFAAAATMEDHDTQHVLGLDRLEALRLFESQFQQSLYAADILEHPTFLLLQGLAIYLVCILVSLGNWVVARLTGYSADSMQNT
ncbi:C6 transcription factor asaR [Beauveria bassiana]|nr:C6 transcription factor asaR [Beauveria bassiana]